MTTNPSPTFEKLLAAAKEIGLKVIRTYPDLHLQRQIPDEIWRAFGDSGLSASGVPKKFSGAELSYSELNKIGEELMLSGNNMGVTMSWVIQQILAKFVVGNFGTAAQQEALLPKIAKGEIKLAFSISEPKAGANPKLLATSAELEGNHYVINGNKAFITNGPIADYFVLFAVTAVNNGRKEFSTFIVPKDTPGLIVSRSDDIQHMLPSCHGNLTLDNCRIPKDARLNTPNSPIECISKPFRDLEDTMLMGPTVGALTVLLSETAGAIKWAGNENSDPVVEQIGKLKSLLDALDAIAAGAASELDHQDANDSRPGLLISFRVIRQQFMSMLSQLIEEFDIELSGDATQLHSEMLRSESLGNKINTIKVKKLGTRLLTQKG